MEPLGSEPLELSESDLFELDDAYREMMDEQAALHRLKKRVIKHLAQTAFEEFPALKNMTAEQIREFGNLITRTAGDFALKAANVAYDAEMRT